LKRIKGVPLNEELVRKKEREFFFILKCDVLLPQ